MSSEDGPFGPGWRRFDADEKSRRYLRSTRALWNFSSVADFTIAEKLWDAALAHKKSIQSEHKAIERAEIRGTLPGAIAKDELLLEQQRYRGYRADAARTEKFREGYEHLNCEEHKIAHELHVITAANLCKTVREGPFRL